MKKILMFLLLSVTVFSANLKNGKYSVEENVVRGKKWRSILEIEVKDRKIADIKYDMVTKDGDLLTKSNDLKRIIDDTDGLNPYEIIPDEYVKIIEKSNYKYLGMLGVDAIAGASESSYKFNKMVKFLIEKSEKGETGKFKGWFN